MRFVIPGLTQPAPCLTRGNPGEVLDVLVRFRSLRLPSVALLEFIPMEIGAGMTRAVVTNHGTYRKEKMFMKLKGKVVDLSQEIYQGMPVYPGHLKTVIWTHLSHEECQRQLGTGFSYETRGIMFCDHGPTHIDSVSHLSREAGAPSVDEIPLKDFITSAICLDVSDIPQKTQFGRKKIEEELKRWKLDIRKGDTVLFYTAQYDRYYGKPEYMTDYPGLNREATEFIIDRGCVSFGVDSASPDMWYDKTYPCHSVCSERKVTHIENLCNLDKVVGRRFTFIMLPLKIRKGTGSPIRAIALVPEGEEIIWELR